MPFINQFVIDVDKFIEKNILDIPDLTLEQKEAIKNYSLKLIESVAEGITKGLIESLKEKNKKDKDIN